MLRDPYPAGAVFVLLAVTVPREVQFDPPVLVSVNLLTRRADHVGDLGAVDQRFVFLRRPPSIAGFGNGLELVAVTGVACTAVFFEGLRLLAMMVDADQQAFAVKHRVGVFGEFKAAACTEMDAVTAAMPGGMVVTDSL